MNFCKNPTPLKHRRPIIVIEIKYQISQTRDPGLMQVTWKVCGSGPAPAPALAATLRPWTGEMDTVIPGRCGGYKWRSLRRMRCEIMSYLILIIGEIWRWFLGGHLAINTIKSPSSEQTFSQILLRNDTLSNWWMNITVTRFIIVLWLDRRLHDN